MHLYQQRSSWTCVELTASLNSGCIMPRPEPRPLVGATLLHRVALPGTACQPWMSSQVILNRVVLPCRP